MVIGNGMIANAFRNYTHDDDFLIFASGISNSGVVNIHEYERELNLLKDCLHQYQNKKIVYFGTCSVYDEAMNQKPYQLHKLMLEEMIMSNANDYLIFRLSNPIGETNNTYTIVNFFINHIINNQSFSIWKNASRNLIAVDDMFKICDYILQKNLFSNSIVNIANSENYAVLDIVKMIESHFSKIANYKIEDKGSNPIIDVSNIEPLFERLNINFGKDYFPSILKKHFHKNLSQNFSF